MGLTIAIIIFIVLLYLVERRYPVQVNRFEENFLAILLATMAVVSFAQVVARYGFNTGWGGALEFTRILFAWMILFGMSYGIKTGSHLGVDALIRLFPKRVFKAAALFGAAASLLYGVALLSADWMQDLGATTRGGGAIDYWSKFFKLGLGMEDLRYPAWADEMFGTGDRVPRWMAYLMLPVGLGLFAFRCLEAFIDIWRDKRELIVAGHEAEDLVAENQNILKD